MNDSRIPCRDFLDDFSAFVDGQLSSARRNEIQAHVDCCPGCLDHLTAYRRGITVLRSIEADAPEDFWTRLERRLWIGPELTVLQGGRTEDPPRRAASWPGSAASVAAAAVLALFVIARGLGPGPTPVQVGPQPIQASVAMTVPEVPELDASATAAVVSLARADDSRAVPRTRRRGVPRSGSVSDPGPELPGIPLAGDPTVTHMRPVSLVRLATVVTPAPWNIDRAVSLP